MNESEFLTIGKQLLDRMEAALDDCGLDVDIERKSDGVVDLEFENGTHIVVNLQAPMRQVWLAAKAGGFHFEWKEGAWRDTRSGEGFVPALAAQVRAQAGVAVSLEF
jgi:CyaY protein